MSRWISALVFFATTIGAWAVPGKIDPSLMGPAVLSPVVRASYLHQMNPQIDFTRALNLALLYDEEGSAEGVSPDWAFAQMLLETSYLRFGGQVSPGQNNFAGLGAWDGGEPGMHFRSPRLGVRAQIQLLKQYASARPLEGRPVLADRPAVKKGAAPTVFGLARSWASDPDYGNKLVAMMTRMLTYADTRTSPTP